MSPGDPAAEPPVILRVDGVTKSFGGVRALRGVHFDLCPGEIHALVGENGAGKSTLMKVLAGNLRADAGTVVLDGQPRRFATPREAQAAGVSIVHQELSLVPNLTVAENVYTGREPTIRWLGFVDRGRLHRQAGELLRGLGLDMRPQAVVGEISVAMQQMVEIAKALSLECKVLILDEPTSALTDREVTALFRVLRELKQRGVGVVYISHKLGEVFEIADRITVFRDGEHVGCVRTGDVSTDDVVRMMVGRPLSNLFPEKAGEVAGEPVLRVERLTRRPAFADVSFELRAGEIVALAGLVGAGRTEVARAIFGADRLDSGRIHLHGRPLRVRSPEQAIANGIAYLPENRKEFGLFLEMAIRANIVASTLKQHSRLGFMIPELQNRTAARVSEQLRVRAESIASVVSSLSGGNQQKVLFGKWLATAVKVFLVDEPTRGIDVGAKSEVHALLRDLANTGVAVLMISSELPEVIGTADRVVVMHEGRIAGELAGERITEENVMLLATGHGEEVANVGAA